MGSPQYSEAVFFFNFWGGELNWGEAQTIEPLGEGGGGIPPSGVSRIVVKRGKNGILGGKKRGGEKNMTYVSIPRGGEGAICVRGGGGGVPPFTPPKYAPAPLSPMGCRTLPFVVHYKCNHMTTHTITNYQIPFHHSLTHSLT